MQYSITYRAADKEKAKAGILARIDEIVQIQPVRDRDRNAIVANAHSMIDQLADDPERDVLIYCGGYVVREGALFSTVSIGGTASLVHRSAEK